MANRERRSIKLSEARSTFSALVNDVYRGQERVVVEKSGIPVAAVVSIRDLKRLERQEAERAERFKVFEEMREAFADVNPEELEREAAKAIEEVRNEQRLNDRAAKV